ncbi:MAG: hypothetical protein WCI18_04070 [Pseudomonadota bacterium]
MIIKLSHFLAPILGFLVSCNKNSSDKVAPTYDICTLKENEETKGFKTCTKEFVNSGTVDSQTCYYTKCKVQATDSECPTYFVKSKASSVPDETYCSYTRPTEL